MMLSDSRNPAASSRSDPGVRMMTAKGLPCSRTSSGSSVAAKSSPWPAPDRPTRVTLTRRNGARDSDMVSKHQKRVAVVPAVETDLLPEQTRRDADTDGGRHRIVRVAGLGFFV